MNKNEFAEYFKTFTFTIIVVVIVSSIIIAKAKLASEYNSFEDEEAIQNDMIGYLIEKYRYFETQEPDNPRITLKIAMLYEMFGSLKQAENEYLKAYEKTDYKSDSILFRLAGLYLTAKRYNEALGVIRGIKDSPKYSVILEKGLFYKRYADILLTRKEYKNALDNYNEAEFYFDKINYKDKKDLLEQKCIAYTNLADTLVMQNRPTEAIEALNKGLELAKNPILYYKLAILNIERDPLSAVKYFEIVNRKEPSIINFDLYRQVLLNLQLKYISIGDMLSADLYKTKFDRLNYQIQSNYLSPNEIEVSGVNFKIRKSIFTGNATIIIKYLVRNKTNIPIDHLSTIAILNNSAGNTIMEEEQIIITPKNKLEINVPAQEFMIQIKTTKKILKYNPNLTLNLLFTKNKNYIVQQMSTINIKSAP